MRSLVLPRLLLIGWTLLVWTSRIRNVVADEDLSTGGRTWRIGAAVVFIGLAGAYAVSLRWSVSWGRSVLAALVVWTVGWWSIRGIGILLDDHDVGFKVIHTVLMAISIGLAMWAWQARDR